ncbi:MAG: 2-amino-4-hydroxy-6-hydroxymethyldihydropteridine diphosphokinase [Rubrobacteridae bacterium]|nr:2-amino-4-hydroxy-6-hydroxymethyldihydropteridine diphosphokinase [Rubrobacteridae bacterium]
MAQVYLSLGSNLGDRLEFVEEAVRRIDEFHEMKVVLVSSVYETKPVDYVDQPNFLNCVIAVETELMPHEVLILTSIVENKLKRERTIHWGPRTIDIDILIYEDKIIDEANLNIPHPRICERAFVVIPLLEIAPEIKVPGIDCLEECRKKVSNQSIEKIGSLKR